MQDDRDEVFKGPIKYIPYEIAEEYVKCDKHNRLSQRAFIIDNRDVLLCCFNESLEKEKEYEERYHAQ